MTSRKQDETKPLSASPTARGIASQNNEQHQPLSKMDLYRRLPSTLSTSTTRKNQNASKSNNKSDILNTTGQEEGRIMDFLHHLSATYGKHGNDDSGQRKTKKKKNKHGPSDSNDTNNNNQILSMAYENTGKRAIPRRDFVRKLQGKALTLVGGGFNNKTSNNNNKKRKASHRWNQEQRHDKRRQTKRQKQPEPDSKTATTTDNTDAATQTEESTPPPQSTLAKSETTAKTFTSNNKNNNKTLQFLNQIQQHFAEYAREMLLLSRSDSANDTMTMTLGNRRHAPQMEWVGTRIRITACDSYPDYIGNMGIVLAVTTRTWCVQFLREQQPHDDESPTPARQSTQESQSKEKQEEQHEPQFTKNTATTTTNPWTLTDAHVSTTVKPKYVPKQGSSVEVLLPLLNQSGPQQPNQDEQQQQQQTNTRCIALTLDLKGT